MRYTKEQVEEARKLLHSWLKPGSKVYTILRHVSSSGMARDIGVVVMTKEGPRHPNSATSRVTGYPLSPKRRDGVRVGGCGMDMGFHLVYGLSRYLYPNGFGCAGERCPSNDHSNGDRDYTKHSRKAPHWHRDGGYALRQEWL